MRGEKGGDGNCGYSESYESGGDVEIVSTFFSILISNSLRSPLIASPRLR